MGHGPRDGSCEPFRRRIPDAVSKPGPPDVAISPASEWRRRHRVAIDCEGVAHGDEGQFQMLRHRTTSRLHLIDEKRIDAGRSDRRWRITTDHDAGSFDGADGETQGRQSL